MTEIREFSTSTVDASERSSRWEAASAELLHKVSVTTPGRRPMAARIWSTRSEDSVVAEVAARSHVVGRSGRDVEEWPTGAVAIAAQLGGAAHGGGLGRRTVVATGQVMVFDADVPFRRAYGQGMHLLMWLVPRADFLAAVSARSAVSRVLEPRPDGVPDPRVGTLTSAMLRGARWHDAHDGPAPPTHPTHAQTSTLGHPHSETGTLGHAHDQTGTLRGPPGSAAGGPSGSAAGGRIGELSAELLPGAGWRPADVLESLRLCVPGAAPSLRGYFLLARHLVDAHLSDADLGAAQIAAGIGISERHLSRVLASEGTSAPRFVTDRRLVRARRDVQDPCLAGVPVADLGRRWGLTAPAHLSRVYKDRFGLTPREDRPRPGGYPIPRLHTT